MATERALILVVTSALFLITAHRLPAPIQELPESPASTPGSAQTPKPKKSPAKPQPTRQADEALTKSKTEATPKVSRFAGKWVGTMPEVPWGNVATELIVDSTGTTMQWQESGRLKGMAKAQLSGDTLQGHFQVGVAETWSITLQGDGTTARVRLQALMNDQTAVFHRVSR